MAIGYGIFSGGLDSMLAARVLMEQGVSVRLLTFATPFFGPERAVISARTIGLNTRVVDLTQPHMVMLAKPKHGYGRFMNPCIDCHALMFRRAGEIMAEEGGDFVFSGEVLGQRPKSQNRRALDIVARESGFADVILRPLSALALPPTRMEESGLIDRTRLLGLSGRSRKPQMEWAEHYGLTDYPSPAGGCLLTDPSFSRRLKELASFGWPLDVRDVELLKWGRHFRTPGGRKLVVGRNQAENEKLETLVRPGDLAMHVLLTPGPLVLLAGGNLDPDLEDVALAATIAVSYSDAPDGETRQVLTTGTRTDQTLTAVGRSKQEFANLMV